MGAARRSRQRRIRRQRILKRSNEENEGKRRRPPRLPSLLRSRIRSLRDLGELPAAGLAELRIRVVLRPTRADIWLTCRTPDLKVGLTGLANPSCKLFL